MRLECGDRPESKRGQTVSAWPQAFRGRRVLHAMGCVPRLGNVVGRAEIRFALGTPGNVRLAIYDVTGRLVRRLVDGPREAGRYAEPWDRTDDRGSVVSAGVYLARFEATGTSNTQKVVVAGK